MYNVPRITLAAAQRSAIKYITNGIVPLLISAPGVGKTTLAHEVARALGAQLRNIRLNSIPPEDAIGLQFIDKENKTTINYPPSWLPAEDGSDGPVLLFFDELTQAPDDFRKGIMSVLNERFLGQRKLPHNCYVMAAGNSAEDGTNVYELDRATASRFGVLYIRPDVEEWSNNYAPRLGIHLSIPTFLRVRSDCFEMSEAAVSSDHAVAPSPRVWEKISPLIKDYERDPGFTQEEKLERLEDLGIQISGTLGEQVGAAFMSTYASTANLTALSELIKMSKEKRRKLTPTSMDALWMYAQGMIWFATDLSKMQQVFGLLDDFTALNDVPFYETRAMVGETILQRAGSVHKLDRSNFLTDPVLKGYMRKWREEADAGLKQEPAPAAEPEALAVAA